MLRRPLVGSWRCRRRAVACEQACPARLRRRRRPGCPTGAQVDLDAVHFDCARVEAALGRYLGDLGLVVGEDDVHTLFRMSVSPCLPPFDLLERHGTAKKTWGADARCIARLRAWPPR